MRTAGSWLTLAALAGVAACTGPSGDTGVDPRVQQVLEAFAPQVLVPALEAVVADADALDAALSTDGAQSAFATLMASWQQVEVLQVGPLASSLSGGEDLRDEIYSWPTVNGCRVDQETVEEDWDSATFFEDNLVNSYGLDALEHLLFAAAETECPEQVGIDDEWAALGEDGIEANRLAYAAAVTSEIRAQASELSGRDLQPSSIDELFAAIFYIDTMTKDRKLAQPLGQMDCEDATCPDDVESLLSGLGAANIAGNLRGFRAAFTGGDGTGFDDLLADVGHDDLGVEILAETDEAIAAADALTTPLDEAIGSGDVEALHDEVKDVTDLLKGDLATVLALQIPVEADGDND